MLFVFFTSFCVVNVFALVPIPLEPQTPCFTHFGECLRYCPGERIPDLEGIESSCITNSAGYQFCKFYHCPPAKCRGKKKDLYGKCYYCPGSCVDGGRKHHNGEAFLSFDLVNNCFCGQDNSKHCTKHPVDQYSYCNHARPGSDGDHNTVVVVENPRPPPPPAKIVAFVPPPQQQQTPAAMAFVPAPTQPPTPRQMAYVSPPSRPQTPPQMAYVPAPTGPPTSPKMSYVPAPTRPPTPTQMAYVPAPTQSYVPPGDAFVPAANNKESTAYMKQPPSNPQHQYQKMVAHPNFSAKSPKSNLQQRSNNNPNIYRNNQYFQGFPNNPHFPSYYGNPYFQQQMWGFNGFNKEIEA
ncbi:uncharacterized protein LOC127731048 isoform X2 [Mytilus californianus]|uniref:uncharacterized protein LOC127731048 isoform X2 n=1 Tax=Mytilus californianus TaxID=6549 RepID=UPI0022458681|nr:uncharacterized protein LOC127731048 isoform X2 [Mytilus californianus]